MTYFEARRAEALFGRFRQLTIDYWAAVKPIDSSWTDDPSAPRHEETDISRPLRQAISTLEPEATHLARRLGAGIEGHSAPGPAIGGVVVPFNLLDCVFNQWVGHSAVRKEEILDGIDRCIGAASTTKRTKGLRLINLLYWFVDIPALIVGLPFAVMRRAGVPNSIVESTSAQVIKAVLTILVMAALIYVGYEVSLSDALSSLKSK